MGFKQSNYSVNRRYVYKYISNKSLGNYGWYIAETAHHSEAPEFTPGFKWGSCCSICVMLY